MRGEPALRALLEQGARAAIGAHREVLYLGKRGGVTRFASSVIHQNVEETDGEFVVRVFDGPRAGVAATNVISPAGLTEVLETALAIARIQPERAGLVPPGEAPPPEPVATHVAATAAVDAQTRAEWIRDWAARAAAEGAALSGAFTVTEGEVAVANSVGTFAYAPVTQMRVNCIAQQEDGSGYATFLGRDADRFDPEALVGRALDKCRRSMAPVAQEPGRYDVILEPPAVAEVLGWMNYIAFGAKRVADGTSFLAGCAGERVLGTNVTIFDDGRDARGLPFPFDLEGTPKRRHLLVDQGVVRGPVHDRETAQAAGTPTTGHAVLPGSPDGPLSSHTFLAPGDAAAADLPRRLGTGLLVTRFHYVNGLLDPKRALMTGMTRDGTFWVEGGEVRHGVQSLRFTESLVEALGRVEAISREGRLADSWWEFGGGVWTPSLLIRGFQFSGRSRE